MPGLRSPGPRQFPSIRQRVASVSQRRTRSRIERPVQEFRRPASRARRHAQNHAGRPQGHHRPERRRKDHAVQCDNRNLPGDRRQHHAVRTGRDQLAEPPAHRARHGAHVPGHEPVSEIDRARQCAAGDQGPAAVEIRDVAVFVVVQRRLRQGLSTARKRRIPRPQGCRSSQSVARRAAPARDCSGPGQRSENSSAGRAGRRSVLGRIHRDGRVPDEARPCSGDPLDRA